MAARLLMLRFPMSAEILLNALQEGRLSITRLDDGSGVVLDSRDEQLFSLNATGLAIIVAIESGETDLAVIAAILSRRFDVDEGQALDDLQSFIRRLTVEL
jgi:hypothetical protein